MPNNEPSAVNQIIQSVISKNQTDANIAASEEAYKDYIGAIRQQQSVFDDYMNAAGSMNGPDPDQIKKTYNKAYRGNASPSKIGGEVSGVSDEGLSSLTANATLMGGATLASLTKMGEKFVAPEMTLPAGIAANRATQKGIAGALKGVAGRSGLKAAARVSNPLMWAVMAGDVADRLWTLEDEDGNPYKTYGDTWRDNQSEWIYNKLHSDDDGWFENGVKQAASYAPNILTDFITVPMSLLEKSYLDTFKGYD